MEKTGTKRDLYTGITCMLQEIQIQMQATKIVDQCCASYKTWLLQIAFSQSYHAATLLTSLVQLEKDCAKIYFKSLKHTY